MVGRSCVHQAESLGEQPHLSSSTSSGRVPSTAPSMWWLLHVFVERFVLCFPIPGKFLRGFSAPERGDPLPPSPSASEVPYFLSLWVLRTKRGSSFCPLSSTPGIMHVTILLSLPSFPTEFSWGLNFTRVPKVPRLKPASLPVIRQPYLHKLNHKQYAASF